MEAQTYRCKLARARQDFVRQRAKDLIKIIDEELDGVPTGTDEVLPQEEVTALLDGVREAFNELERLLGDALHGVPRHNDLRRHLYFADPHDARDIAALDWPSVRPYVELAVYGDDALVPVEVTDSGTLATQTAAAPVPSRVHWNRLDADGFERLLGRILEHSRSYAGVNRLMAINSTDAGRDLEAPRTRETADLGGPAGSPADLRHKRLVHAGSSSVDGEA